MWFEFHCGRFNTLGVKATGIRPVPVVDNQN